MSRAMTTKEQVSDLPTPDKAWSEMTPLEREMFNQIQALKEELQASNKERQELQEKVERMELSLKLILEEARKIIEGVKQV